LKLRLGTQVETVDKQTQATEKYNGSEIGGDQRRDRYRQSEAAIPGRKILNDTGQQHVQEPATNLVTASGAFAGRQLNLRNVLAAMGAASKVREHGFPTEHARACGKRLILQGNGHVRTETSIFSLGLGSGSVKAAAYRE
jgi:hypothetical protein